MKNDNYNKAMATPETFVPVYYYVHPVTGDILDLADDGKIIVKNEDRHPDSPPYTNSKGETFDVWTGELLSRPAEAEEREQWYREEAVKEAAAKATDAPNEDEVIEANTDGEFTVEDIEDALNSRTPAMQALLRAKPDERE